MPLVDRIILVLAGLLVLLGLGGAVYIEHERADAAEAKVEVLTAQAAASQAALTAYTTAQVVTQARAQTNQKAVSNALASNPAAASTLVPDDVFASLYGNRPHAAAIGPASGVPRTSSTN